MGPLRFCVLFQVTLQSIWTETVFHKDNVPYDYVQKKMIVIINSNHGFMISISHCTHTILSPDRFYWQRGDLIMTVQRTFFWLCHAS